MKNTTETRNFERDGIYQPYPFKVSIIDNVHYVTYKTYQRLLAAYGDLVIETRGEPDEKNEAA